ncbi:MAG TPA: NUDIX hydrolase YfcD [Deferrisomatales bacterium]|nr:NUDIX hydrolase YfcD [Deferrisomatales bacterium]
MTREEIVAIVDDHNRVVGSAPRSEMRAKGLPHRATYILVFNSRGEVFVQRRTLTKDVYPGYLDPCTGGVVLAGESYEQSAARELSEELDIAGVPLVAHFDLCYRDGDNHVWGRVFSCTWNGPVTLQPEEVADGFWLAPAAVLVQASKELFTPDSLEVLARFLREEVVPAP